MSGDKPEVTEPTPQEQVGEARSAFVQRYNASSRLEAEGEGSRLALAADASRPVLATAVVKDPVRVREALSSLREVVESDLRYKPKDRTAYLAFQRMRKQAAGMSQWAAQRAYFEWLSRNDPLAFCVLDPVVTVHESGLLFEAFSKDEGTYAQLSVGKGALEFQGELAQGTTNIDFGESLVAGVQRLRSYRKTTLSVATEAVKLSTEGQPEVIEKQVQVPDAWLRGFLQVQSAATLASDSFSLTALDLYNVLRHLRLSADRKTGGRAMRVELVPGENPRLVLEPWETVIETSAGPYKGRVAKVVRLWGRRRLMLARRFLPFTERVDVHLLGSGLPSFFVLSGGDLSLTLGLSGFTASNWARALSFDVLLPRPSEASAEVKAVLEHLGKGGATAVEVTKATKLAAATALSALQAACQLGLAVYDVAAGLYRTRPLSAELDLAKLTYRSLREREAHDLVADKAAVKIVTENRIFGVGLELVGKVTVAAEKREYRPVVTIDDEGRVRKAECTCAFFRKHELKEGPCVHLMALRLLQAKEEAKRAAAKGKGRASVTVETRTYTKRHKTGETLRQLSLDRTRVKIRWGERSDERLRVQSLVFDTAADARAAYFARVDELESQGFLDATAG